MKHTKRSNPIRRKISDFELIPHGFQADFSGCGVGSGYKRVITSVGSCEEEAYANALDQIEQMEGGEFDWSEVESRAGKLSTLLWDGREEEGVKGRCEVWFYFSIRYTLSRKTIE